MSATHATTSQAEFCGHGSTVMGEAIVVALSPGEAAHVKRQSYRCPGLWLKRPDTGGLWVVNYIHESAPDEEMCRDCGTAHADPAACPDGNMPVR